MVMLLMVRVVFAQVRTVRSTSCRARHGSDERRIVQKRALQGHREDRRRRRGRGSTAGGARTHHGVCAVRARGAMVVLHGRGAEERRQTF